MTELVCASFTRGNRRADSLLHERPPSSSPRKRAVLLLPPGLVPLYKLVLRSYRHTYRQLDYEMGRLRLCRDKSLLRYKKKLWYTDAFVRQHMLTTAFLELYLECDLDELFEP
jgi:hypothetical protein